MQQLSILGSTGSIGTQTLRVVERFPEQIAALKDRQTFAIGGGESWPEVFQRADASLLALRERMPDGGRAIVFTHGGIIAALLSGLHGMRLKGAPRRDQ